MPSLIGQPGYATTNYLKTKPSTRFATRQLAFYLVHGTNVGTDYADSNSNFTKAVRAIQTQAEIYAVGVPQADDFIVVVAQDTANDGVMPDAYEANDMAKTLSQVTGLTVTAKHLSGNGFANGLMAYSDEAQANSFDNLT